MKNNIRYHACLKKQEVILFISDIHAPYQDNMAIRAVIAFGKELQPDRIILMGDIVDFYAISSFRKDPIRALQLQKEIDEAVSILRIIRNEFPKIPIDLIQGNHEQRLQKYLWTKASELSGLRQLNVPALLKLESFNITYHSTGRMKYRGLMIKHGDKVRKHSAYTARGEFDETGLSGISAHTHRIGLHCQTNEAGRYFWYEIGCLCKLNAEYMEGKTPNWQQGFAVGYFKKGSAKCNIHIIPIVCGKALYQGKEYYGRSK